MSLQCMLLVTRIIGFLVDKRANLGEIIPTCALLTSLHGIVNGQLLANALQNDAFVQTVAALLRKKPFLYLSMHD